MVIIIIIIENYVPDYFFGEKFNPACDNCKEKVFSWSSPENLANDFKPEPDPTSSHSVKYNVNTAKNIAEHFEEFLEHFEHDGSESKYSLLAKNLSTSGERGLDVQSYSMYLNDSIDLCYKKAFPQICSALRNFIREKVDSDEASKDFLVKIII